MTVPFDNIFLTGLFEGDFLTGHTAVMGLLEGQFFPVQDDFYLIYKDRNNADYDYYDPIVRMGEDDTTVGISDMRLEPDAGRNIWHFGRIAVSKYGVISEVSEACLVTVDSDAYMVLPCGNHPIGVSAVASKDGTVQLDWQYFSQGEDATPDGFKIYRYENDVLTITGTLTPNVIGNYVNIGPQAASGAYDPTEPDPDVYHINISGQDWYIWHDSNVTEYWYITDTVGNEGAADRWYRIYADGIIGTYTDTGTATGIATVAIGTNHWVLQSDIDYTGGRNYTYTTSSLTHGTNYKFTVRSYKMGDELIANGTMEADSNWTTVSAADINVRSSEQVYAGMYSRKFHCTSAADGIKSDNFTTVGGKRYKISVYVYPVGYTQIRIAMRRGDDTGFLFANNYALTTDTWNLVEIDFTDTSAGGAGAYLRLTSHLEIDETWYIDNASVKQYHETINDDISEATADDTGPTALTSITVAVE